MRLLQLGDRVGLSYSPDAAGISGAKVIGLWRRESEQRETPAPTFRNMALAALSASRGDVVALVLTRAGVLLFVVRAGTQWYDARAKPVVMRIEG